MSELQVGAGQQYATIAAALAASQDGDVISVQAGTYANDFAHIITDVTLRAVGGPVSLVATVSPPDGKAIFTTDADVTIDGFEFSGARVPDGNGAGIRQQTGDLTVLNSYFHDNENGILTAQDASSTVTIRDSEFERNGNGLGNTHGIYVGHIGKLVVERSFFHDTLEGHQLKSRAIENVITDSRFFDDDGTGSYSIDLPNGGIATLSGNVLQQGPNGHNPIILAYGEEGSIIPGSRLTMTDTVIVNDRSGGTAIWNAAGAPATASGTEVFGLASGQMASGPVSFTDTTYLTARPALDESSPWSGDGPTEPPVSPPDPEPPTEPPVLPPDPEPPTEPPVSPPDPEPPTEPPVSPPDPDVPPADRGDTFSFQAGDGHAHGGPFVIRDFDLGQDRLVAPDDTRFADQGVVYETWASTGAYLNESGTWVQWSWGDQERVFLAGVQASLAEIEAGAGVGQGAGQGASPNAGPADLLG